MTPRRFAHVVAALLVVTAAALAGEAPPFATVEVSPSVVAAIHDRGSNVVCVALPDGLVFVDASLSTEVASRFRREMEARFKRPARTLLVTHAHLDHILGMGAFSDLEVVAAASGRPRWERMLQLPGNEKAVAVWAAVFPSLPEDVADAGMRLPTTWFDDGIELGDGDTRLAVRRTGGHTVDSSSAVMANEGVVIAGDLVQARRRPYFGEPDTDLAAWIAALSRWQAMAPKAVVGGHGPVIDAAELGVIRAWFEGTVDTVGTLKRAGVALTDVLDHPGLPAGYWPAEEQVKPWWPGCYARLYETIPSPS